MGWPRAGGQGGPLLEPFGPIREFVPRLDPWGDKKEEGLQPASHNPCTQMVPKGRGSPSDPLSD